MLPSIAVLALTSAVVAGSAASAAPPVKVFVTAAQPEARKKLDPETKKELSSRADAARHARQDLEKQMKTELGKKEEAWPEDKQNALYDAREAEALAMADWQYRSIDPEALSDSGEDVKKALAKRFSGDKSPGEIVESRDAADVVVELVARRSAYDASAPSLMGKNNAFYISFTLSPGPKMDPVKLLAVKTYRFKSFGFQAWVLQRPKPDNPTWRFDAYGVTAWRAAATSAAMLVADFIEKNLAQPPTKAPVPLLHRPPASARLDPVRTLR